MWLSILLRKKHYSKKVVIQINILKVKETAKNKIIKPKLSSVQFSRLVVSDSL